MKDKGIKQELYDNRVFIAVALVIILALQFVGTVRVKGNSMEPNFHHYDVVLMNKAAYIFSKPEYGDVVICRYDELNSKELIIKRVIGVPGDVIDIELNEDNKAAIEFTLSINGEILEEDYINGTMEQSGDCEYPFTVPENSYFVMGDNRNSSSDSRRKQVGAINLSEIDGKVVFRLYPFDSIGAVK